MLKVGGGLDLNEEALSPHQGCQLRLQDLHGHLPVVLQVLSQIDRSHTSAADLALDGVAVGKCLSQTFFCVPV